ncbi:unnamed protein product [Cuscuta campestris]|uniref:C2H2-type domain-containing protein n=2 Tax=Cuscuta sect. Cleistogrammica TaxID=1824901 RepID=A0A484NT48_9ASTE|nr:hypothetical protein DM860_011465 [Cuscuta australis]VFR03207.1 unnamed protein product [Cuscuta campestris]
MLEAAAGPSSSSSETALTSQAAPQNAASMAKRKRRPAGTPDPGAEVISLSPKTLLESDRYVCEFCNQGFQREQNLQMHQRRHNVPWEVLKRPPLEMPLAETARKKVYVCPEPTCLHHDPRHALGDLVGIKKHYRRKHSNNKQWVCSKCSKGYAVQADYKAHLKTCGTRGHCCDCGLVFSRVESFIEHQDACEVKQKNGSDTKQPLLERLCSSTPPSTTTNSSGDTNFSSILPLPMSLAISPAPVELPNGSSIVRITNQQQQNCLELQLLPPSSTVLCPTAEDYSTGLSLSIGLFNADPKTQQNKTAGDNVNGVVYEELKVAMDEKAYADERREEARRLTELAELEFASAKRIRLAAKAELEEAVRLQEQSTRKISALMLEITCQSCKRKFSY